MKLEDVGARPRAEDTEDEVEEEYFPSNEAASFGTVFIN